MGVLEKITANMKLFELKKSKLQTAMRTLMLEWEHIDEYMESTQHNFQKCFDELIFKEKKLISVQESIEEKFEQIESKAEKLAVKQQSVEGILMKIKFEEKRVEDILKNVEERNEEVNSKEMQLEKRSKELDCVQDGIERRIKELDAKEVDIEKRRKELESKEKELGDQAREIESRAKEIALMRKLSGNALVPGEVEAPPAVAAPAQKRAKNMAEACKVRNKRAASSSILAAPKRPARSVKLEYEEEVAVPKRPAPSVKLEYEEDTQGGEASDDEMPLSFRMASVNKGGKDYLSQQGEANEDDEDNSTQQGEASEDSVPLSFSNNVDPEVVQKVIPGPVNHDLASTSNARSPPHHENPDIIMGEYDKLDKKFQKYDNEVGSLIELDKKFQDSMAESAKKLNAKVLAWEARFSKIQGEINKAGKLLTGLDKNRI